MANTHECEANLGIFGTYRILQKICGLLRSDSRSLNQLTPKGRVWLDQKSSAGFSEVEIITYHDLSLNLPKFLGRFHYRDGRVWCWNRGGSNPTRATHSLFQLKAISIATKGFDLFQGTMGNHWVCTKVAPLLAWVHIRHTHGPSKLEEPPCPINPVVGPAVLFNTTSGLLIFYWIQTR